MASIYELGLEKNDANYVPLTPMSFLARAAQVHPQRVAIVHGALRQTWRETDARCRRLASALLKRGIGRGDTVAALMPNVPALIEAHFGVPMSGAVLNALNTRLDAESIAFMLAHGEAKALLVDRELAAVASAAVDRLGRDILLVDVDAPELGLPPTSWLGYEALLAEGDPSFVYAGPEDEWDAICLNYTSGTTGNPKGVVYHHRGACLNAISNILEWDLPKHPVYLWTLPLFHCNGWCFAWTVAARAGTNVCLRKVEAKAVFDLIREHRVTHYCGAPDRPFHARQRRGGTRAEHHAPGVGDGRGRGATGRDDRSDGEHRLRPHARVRAHRGLRAGGRLREARRVAGAAGLRTRAPNARQGVRYHLQEAVTVLDPATMQPVPADGETMGEVMFRGNITMKGYLKNPSATRGRVRGRMVSHRRSRRAVARRVLHIKDRSKDIIISGGENISSIEVEDALCRHPACWRRRWSPSQTRSGVRRRVRSSSFVLARRSRRKLSSPSVRNGSRASRCRARWSSARCREPRPERYRSSSCARALAHRGPSTAERPTNEEDDMSEFGLIEITEENDVFTIEIGGLDSKTHSGLARVFRRAHESDARVVVVTGKNKTFIAPEQYDFEWVKKLGIYTDMLQIFREAEDIIRDQINCDKPTIAKVYARERTAWGRRSRWHVTSSTRVTTRRSAIRTSPASACRRVTEARCCGRRASV